MVGRILWRGMLAGLVAGLLGSGFAKLAGEPIVDLSIAFESAMDAAKGHPPEEELVSRETQSTFGLLTGVVVYGTSIGGLFALVFAFAAGRVGRIDPRALALLLAFGAFLAIAVVPGLKYPANPPAVGDPETIGHRTALYFVMLAISIAAISTSVVCALRWRRRWGDWNAAIAAAAGFVVVIAVTQLVLPDVNEVPDDFPAVVLWRFREASLGLHFVMWTTIGLLFGWLTERDARRRFAFTIPV